MGRLASFKRAAAKISAANNGSGDLPLVLKVHQSFTAWPRCSVYHSPDAGGGIDRGEFVVLGENI